MKLPKNKIRLSDSHPTMLLKLQPQPVLVAPLVIDSERNLIDGYRRFQLAEGEVVDVISMPVENVFHAALALNQRTRSWDGLDCFLWTRWARQMRIANVMLPITKFPDDLFHISDSLLFLLAQRRLTLRQVILLTHAPKRYREFFQEFLQETIHLNDNETATFIEMASDLKTTLEKRSLEEVFQETVLAGILDERQLTPKQRGERLLEEMRRLRYPYYQRKSDEFSLLWQQLDLGTGVNANKRMFVEREILQVTWSAASFEEAKDRAERLYRSLNSQVWSKIWER